jgi:hypothetical protein
MRTVHHPRRKISLAVQSTLTGLTSPHVVIFFGVQLFDVGNSFVDIDCIVRHHYLNLLSIILILYKVKISTNYLLILYKVKISTNYLLI